MDATVPPRWLVRFVTSIPPFSLRATAVALLCFVSALAVQMAFRSIGGSPVFSTYPPAVLFAGILAGLPAGIFVMIAAWLTVWWAFLSPQFTFFPVSLAQQMDMAAFLLACGCVLTVSEWYRTTLWQLRKTERERELIMKELEHRGKNTYAVLDAIIQKTFEDQPERANVASGRIRAVKYANDLLTQTSVALPIQTLLLQEFSAYGEARFHANGADVQLSPDTARHLALAFHELVTNAAKYGALSNPDGRVLISWQKVDGVVRLEWTEDGGPVVSPPTKYGFGSKIVAQSLKSLSGSITPTFAPEGLRCSITFRD
jgi:two-component sensor histidine kinase